MASDWREKLQARIEANTPKRRKLTDDEQLRLSKLEGIENTLTTGKNVQNRQLQRWLTNDEYEQIELEWDAQKSFREELKNKPTEIKRYEDKLKEAIMMSNRADSSRDSNFDSHSPTTSIKR